MPLDLVLLGALLTAMSGLAGIVSSRRGRLGERLAAAAMAAGGLAAGAGALMALTAGAAVRGWGVTAALAAKGWVGLDGLSAFFAVPVAVMGALGAFYGLGYWPQRRHASNGRRMRLFWGVLTSGMLLLLVARHAFLFLLGWEGMAISAFLLICTDDRHEAVRRAGYVYFVATHISTLCLFAVFGLMRSVHGHGFLVPLPAAAFGVGGQTLIFLLALTGFGLKAGLMPLHFWLPAAHANAPTHVSAILSGVVIKMGIYGLLRMLMLLPHPPVAWGVGLLVAGTASGILGVVYALGQHDLKRLLAYHSVENIGIITIGLGLAVIGRALARPAWMTLGMAGCLLHVWNHGLFKSLLFMSAGSVIQATGTREMDCMGGLAKPMRWSAAFFAVGAVAICGLPPLNGFVSEWLIYLGLLRPAAGESTGGWALVALAAPALAMIGALAAACFVKAFGCVFLGAARRTFRHPVHEAPLSMRVPMGVLAAGCAVIGLVPLTVRPALEEAVTAWSGVASGAAIPAPLTVLTRVILIAALPVLAAGIWLGRRHLVAGTTWDCGFVRMTPRMQYSASSFAQLLVGLFHGVLRPTGRRPRLRTPFPLPAAFHTHVHDLVLERRIEPAAAAMGRQVRRLRMLHRGLTQNYLLYILITVIALLLWSMPWSGILGRLFSRT